MKHKGRIVVIVIFLLLSILCIKKIYTITREEYKIINYALDGYEKYFKVKYIRRYDDAKECDYFLFKKKNCSPKVYEDIQNRIEEYLDTHSEYFLNNSYKLYVSFTSCPKQGPSYLQIMNYLDRGSLQYRYDGLKVIYVNWHILDTMDDYSELTDLKNVEIIQIDWMGTDVLKAITKYDDLKLILCEEKIEKKEREYIEKRWPECEVRDALIGLN